MSMLPYEASLVCLAAPQHHESRALTGRLDQHQVVIKLMVVHSSRSGIVKSMLPS